MGNCFEKHDDPPSNTEPLMHNNHHTHSHDPPLPANSPARIRKLFNAIDVNKSGGITISELQRALYNPVLERELGWPPHKYQVLFDLLDPTRTGTISEEKLQHFCKVRWLFSEIDTSKNGGISAWELETALLKNPVVQRELQVPCNMAASLFQQMDTDSNGSISIVEFYRYYTSASKEPFRMHSNWEDMAVKLLERMDIDRSGAVSLAELASALSNRSLQLELGWPAHKANDLFNFLDADHSGIVSLENLRMFCKMRWLFQQIDTNTSGFIDNFEFGKALQSVSMQQELNVNVGNAQTVWLSMDPGRTNSVSFEAFYRYFTHKRVAPPQPPPQPTPKPQKPGDAYEVVKKIGEGGFGTVFLIKRKSDGLQLIMKKPKLDSGVLMEEVKQEAELMQRLKHPNIVRFIESYDEGGSLIIILEYVSGGDLRKKMGNPPQGLPPGDVYKIFKDSLEGLKYIHAKKILHRDLKPDNILLTGGGGAKIADLGLATQLQPTARVAQTQCGTPVYMAPELLHGRPYDHKADMFSMGCILNELCTGKLSYTNQADIVNNKQPTNTPRWCEPLVRALLEPDPRRRLNSEEALSMLAGLTPNSPPRMPPRRHSQQQPVVYANGHAPHFR